MSQVSIGQSGEIVAEQQQVDRRSAFIARTYAHLLLAVLAFVGLEITWFSTGVADLLRPWFARIPWLLILGAFIVIGWFASRLAHRARSPVVQYAGLVALVLAWSIIFIPLLGYANNFAPGTISSAALTTILGFCSLTLLVMITRRDFSFLRTIVVWGFILALLLIVAAYLFGFRLGTWFSVGMVGLAGASILYDTSRILRSFPLDRHVGAAVELFASVAVMFWYLLRLFTGSRG